MYSCSSSYECEDDVLLCATSSNCSTECLGDYSCDSAIINGSQAQSLYSTSGHWAAYQASIYCTNNFQNGVIDLVDSHSDNNISIPISRAVIDCSTKSGSRDMCRPTTFYCGNSDIVKMNCGETSGDYAECMYSFFEVANIYKRI